MPEQTGNPLIALQGVTKSFRTADGAPRTVLEQVDFALAEGEIVVLAAGELAATTAG